MESFVANVLVCNLDNVDSQERYFLVITFNNFGGINNCYKIWDKVFKNGSSNICGRQPLKTFTWSTLKYFVPYNML